MPVSWRSWWPGPKHGMARRVAVYSAPNSNDPDRLTELLARCETLRTWASSYGVALPDDPEGLAALDGHLDTWATAPEIGPALGNEVGLYLGAVIVKNVLGAAWQAWPNGHPVVRLRSGRDLDVLALAHQRLAGEGRDLPAIYADAASS